MANSGISTELKGRDSVDAVTLMYQTVFGRAPDGPGLSFWVNQMESGGLTIDNLAVQLLASPEYQVVHAGQTEAEQIDSFYFNAKGIHATPEEEAYWSSVGLAKAAVLIDTAKEVAIYNDNGLHRFETLALNGAVPDSTGNHLDNSPLTVTNTETVYVPTPIFEQHNVVNFENVQIDELYRNPDGSAPVGGSGTPSTGWNQITDYTAGVNIYVEVQPRQSPLFYTPATVSGADAEGVVHYSYNVPGGTQNNPYGVNPLRADTSVGFLIAGTADYLLNPDYEELFHFTGPGGYFVNAELHTTPAGVQSLIVYEASNPVLVGANIIGDDPISTTKAGNTTNLAFVPFGGNPDAHGDYSMEIEIVKVVGVSSPVTVAGVHIDIHAT